MENCSPAVAVIVDGEFGDRVVPVSASGALWIAGSATNQAAVDRLRRNDTPYMISVFQYDQGLSGAEALADILPEERAQLADLALKTMQELRDLPEA